MAHRPFKQRLYTQFARIGVALASDRRLELLDLLAQAPRDVGSLAGEMEMPVANVSQHLQVLRNARLVEVEKAGTRAVYRLADERVLQLWLALRAVAEHRLAEVGQIIREFGADGGQNFLSREELEPLLRSGRVVLLDVRPPLEYESGHIPGAICIPVDELPQRAGELPRNRRIVAYCRGEYCLFANEAVSWLREHGFDAWRLEGGWPEWRAEGRAVESESESRV